MRHVRVLLAALLAPGLLASAAFGEDGTTLAEAFSKVHRIQGSTWDSDSHVLNARFKLGEHGKWGSLTPYAYLLDFENVPQFAVASASYGLVYQGKCELDFQFLYTAPWKQGFGLKGALYYADELSTDTIKFWMVTTYKI